MMNTDRMMMNTDRMMCFLIRTIPKYRKFSTGKKQLLSTLCYDANKIMLLSTIESIYNHEWRVRGVLPFRVERLQEELFLKDNFQLGGIEYYQYRKSEIPSFHYNMLFRQASLGYLWMNEWDQDGDPMIGVYQCREPTDLFLMTALSRVLIRRFGSRNIAPITTNVQTLNDVKCMHYAFWNRQQNVEKLIMIDLTPCMKQVRISRIFKYFDNAMRKGVVFNLLKQILYLSIYDIKSNQIIPFNQIPPIGEITNVIFHLFYQMTIL
jgi:hypothetical protein